MKKSLLALVAIVAAGMAAAAKSIRGFLRSCGEKLERSTFAFMARNGLVLFANFYSTQQTTFNSTASGNAPATRVKANQWGGRLRIFESTYTVPAAAGPGIGDKIIWGKLPVKARIIGHLCNLGYAAGAASSTLNLGDNTSAARHMAATSVAAAGNTVPSVQSASGASMETSDDSANFANGFVSATDDCTLISTVAGAALGAGQVITLRVVYVCD